MDPPPKNRSLSSTASEIPLEMEHTCFFGKEIWERTRKAKKTYRRWLGEREQ
jgi:hypothetical protein